MWTNSADMHLSRFEKSAWYCGHSWDGAGRPCSQSCQLSHDLPFTCKNGLFGRWFIQLWGTSLSLFTKTNPLPRHVDMVFSTKPSPCISTTVMVVFWISQPKVMLCYFQTIINHKILKPQHNTSNLYCTCFPTQDLTVGFDSFLSQFRLPSDILSIYDGCQTPFECWTGMAYSVTSYQVPGCFAKCTVSGIGGSGSAIHVFCYTRLSVHAIVFAGSSMESTFNTYDWSRCTWSVRLKLR